jgi:hypothetical protein
MPANHINASGFKTSPEMATTTMLETQDQPDHAVALL